MTTPKICGRYENWPKPKTINTQKKWSFSCAKLLKLIRTISRNSRIRYCSFSDAQKFLSIIFCSLSVYIFWRFISHVFFIMWDECVLQSKCYFSAFSPFLYPSLSLIHTHTHVCVFRHFHVVFVWQYSCSFRCSHILSHISCCATIWDVCVCVCVLVSAQNEARQADETSRSETFSYMDVSSHVHMCYSVFALRPFHDLGSSSVHQHSVCYGYRCGNNLCSAV